MGVGLPIVGQSSIRIEANVTYRCNALCQHCDKAVGYAKMPGMDITADQMQRAVDQLNEQNIRVTRFTFCGGEPVMNRELQGIVDQVSRLPGLKIGRVLTNDLPGTKAARDKITMPNFRFKWIPAPLDDPADPTSGKSHSPNRRTYRRRSHLPFWISPVDIGLEGKFENCRARTWCGKGFDANGFAACGKAGVFGRLFDVDPYMRDGDIVKHVDTPIESLCRHCVYGLPSDVQRRVQLAARDGKLPYNEVSPTFERAFEQWQETVVRGDHVGMFARY